MIAYVIISRDKRTQQSTNNLAVPTLIRHLMTRWCDKWIGWIKKWIWQC